MLNAWPKLQQTVGPSIQYVTQSSVERMRRGALLLSPLWQKILSFFFPPPRQKLHPSLQGIEMLFQSLRARSRCQHSERSLAPEDSHLGLSIHLILVVSKFPSTCIGTGAMRRPLVIPDSLNISSKRRIGRISHGPHVPVELMNEYFASISFSMTEA